MKPSGRLTRAIPSASNDVLRSREREKVAAGRMRVVGNIHSFVAGTEVRCRILAIKKLR